MVQGLGSSGPEQCTPELDTGALQRLDLLQAVSPFRVGAACLAVGKGRVNATARQRAQNPLSPVTLIFKGPPNVHVRGKGLVKKYLP